MYIPIVKTTAAEIKGYDRLSEEVKSAIFPLFELTKDRTHRVNYPEGRLEKALEKALNAQPTGRMILDLTSHQDLINSEIERLFDGSNGYENWCSFIRETGRASDITPVIQIDGDQFDDNPELAGEQITTQVRSLFNLCGAVAFRANLDIEPDELSEFLSYVCTGLENLNSLTVILDAEYIRPFTADTYASEICSRVMQLTSTLGISNFAVAASSFPKTVTASNYGEDGYGHFRIEEVVLHSLITQTLPNTNITYSDYALIHPVRYDVRGGAWVPRVDVPLSEEVYYYRYRREDGGYIAAARDAVADEKYSSVNSWGNTQIELAANNRPAGLSPSFWISVRSNVHMTTQAIRTGSISR